MSATLVCPHGHTWLESSDGSAAKRLPLCPVCSAPASMPTAEIPPPANAALARAEALLTLAHVAYALPAADGQTLAGDAKKGKDGDQAPASVQVPGYEILGELGRGAMGVVYKARQVKADREVALKMVLAGAQASPMALDRFRTEAEAAARLSHPNIAQVYEVGEYQGLPFFSLEYCARGSLSDNLRGTPLPAEQAAALVQRLALAVQAAHDRNVVHRDLKPANVLLADDGSPKVTDFGLAKKLDARASQTIGEAVMGTPSYMAPEQAGGRAREAGPPADVYALGAILYECLTGRPPFRAPTMMQTLRQVTDEEPVPPSRLSAGVPRDLETICLKCLEKAPARRYASAADLAEDLRHFQAREPIAARPVGRLERGWKWVRRNPAVAGLLAAVALSLTAGTTVSYLKYREAREHAADARGKAEDLGMALSDLHQKAQALQVALGERDTAASKAREKEEHARHLLDNSRFQLACAALEDRQTSLAAERLDAIRPRQRGWEWHYLRRRLEGGIFALAGHTDAVKGVCFSPDGSRLATASGDGTARVWDARSGAPLLELKGHAGGLWGVCFSPDGSRLATASHDRTARVWDTRSGSLLRKLEGHTGWVSGVCFSPDGARLATASGDHTARVWDARSGDLLRELRGHARGLWDVCFSPDGEQLATASHDWTARVWDARSGAVLLKLERHTGWVSGVCFSPDGARLATASHDRTARVWDARSGSLLLELKGHADPVSGVCFSPDGARLATASHDRTARVWDARSGSPLLQLKGHTGGLWGVCFSPDGERLATASHDRTARVWDARSGALLRELKGHAGYVFGVCFSPDGSRLATASEDNTARVWDARSGAPLLELKEHTDVVYGVCFSPDGAWLATASGDGTARVWDARSGAPLLELKGHAGGLWGVCFSPDGARLATASEDNTARVWDTRSGDRLLELRGHADTVKGVCFSPDGARLATASEDNTARVWDARSGDRLLELKGHADTVRGVCFSPDGSRLATASEDNTARVWDARSGAPLLELRGHADAVSGVCFSPDGARLATASGDKAARVWDARSSARLLELKGHTAWVNGVCFSPDGARLATASNDRTARVWDARTGAPLRELKGHTSYVFGVCFSPDGARVATASWDGTARVWDARTGDLLRELEGHAGRLLGVSFSTDGSQLHAWAEPGQVIAWDLATGQPAPRDRMADPFQGSDRSPDGRRVAVRLGEIVRLIDLGDWDSAERFDRLWFTRPDPDWHEAELDRLTAAPDRSTATAGSAGPLPEGARMLAARFHYERLLAYRPDRRRELLARRPEFYPGDPLTLARTAVHTPGAAAHAGRARPAVLFLAMQRDPLALRTLGGLLLRGGKPAEALAPLRSALALRGADRPPVEELLLASACAELKRPGEARDWLRRADAWVDRYQQPFRIAGALGCAPGGPLAAASELLKAQPDPRHDPADWETWHELEVYRAEASRRLAACLRPDDASATPTWPTWRLTAAGSKAGAGRTRHRLLNNGRGGQSTQTSRPCARPARRRASPTRSAASGCISGPAWTG